MLTWTALRFAGASGASLPRSTIIAIAVAVAGGVVLVGIIVLLGLLWYAADRHTCSASCTVMPRQLLLSVRHQSLENFCQ